MGVVVTYDVSDKNPEMKKEMTAKGYKDFWLEGPDGKETRVNLPNSTLWNKKKTVDEGLQDMKNAAASVKVRLERALALPDDPSRSISGDPHS